MGTILIISGLLKYYFIIPHEQNELRMYICRIKNRIMVLLKIKSIFLKYLGTNSFVFFIFSVQWWLKKVGSSGPGP